MTEEELSARMIRGTLRHPDGYSTETSWVTFGDALTYAESRVVETTAGLLAQKKRIARLESFYDDACAENHQLDQVNARLKEQLAELQEAVAVTDDLWQENARLKEHVGGLQAKIDRQRKQLRKVEENGAFVPEAHDSSITWDGKTWFAEGLYRRVWNERHTYAKRVTDLEVANHRLKEQLAAPEGTEATPSDVECIAEAIYSAPSSDIVEWDQDIPWEDLPEDVREGWRDGARAAISAIEGTEAGEPKPWPRNEAGFPVSHYAAVPMADVVAMDSDNPAWTGAPVTETAEQWADRVQAIVASPEDSAPTDGDPVCPLCRRPRSDVLSSCSHAFHGPVAETGDPEPNNGYPDQGPDRWIEKVSTSGIVWQLYTVRDGKTYLTDTYASWNGDPRPGWMDEGLRVIDHTSPEPERDWMGEVFEDANRRAEQLPESVRDAVLKSGTASLEGPCRACGEPACYCCTRCRAGMSGCMSDCKDQRPAPRVCKTCGGSKVVERPGPHELPMSCPDCCGGSGRTDRPET